MCLNQPQSLHTGCRSTSCLPFLVLGFCSFFFFFFKLCNIYPHEPSSFPNVYNVRRCFFCGTTLSLSHRLGQKQLEVFCCCCCCCCCFNYEKRKKRERILQCTKCLKKIIYWTILFLG